jgi:hypothetical protein
MREAARLQSFPDHFAFTGSKVDVAHQIGNAVPPLLAEAIGRSIRTLLQRGATLDQSADILQMTLPLPGPIDTHGNLSMAHKPPGELSIVASASIKY